MSEVQTPFVAGYFMNHSFDYPSPAPAHLSPGTLGPAAMSPQKYFSQMTKIFRITFYCFTLNTYFQR